MNIKKRSTLGSKGIEALLAATKVKNAYPDPAPTAKRKNVNEEASKTEINQGLMEVDVKRLNPGAYQPRRIMRQADLETLAESVKAQGILQPIVVRSKPNGIYEIIAGERRWRAAQLAGLEKVPVIVKEVPDESAMAIALIENIQRENLSPLEEAQALERLAKEFNLTHNAVAEAIGKSRATVSNLLRLLTLNDEVKGLLEQGSLEAGHAKVLLSLKGAAQNQLAQTIAIKGLSVRETERMVAKILDKISENGQKKSIPPKDPDVRRLENGLSEKLGADLEIIHSTNGRGKIVIQYNSLEELDGIIAHIK